MKKTICLGYLFCVLVCLPLLSGCSREKVPPTAVQGVLDLTAWDFGRDGNVPLRGQWELYWGKLLEPDSFTSGELPEKTGYSDLSRGWEDYRIDGEKLPGRGFATFRLLVKISPNNGLKSLKIYEVCSVCDIWVNGRRLASSGQIGTTGKSERPTRPLLLPVFMTEKRSIEIVVQISNFHYPAAGVYLRFGTAANTLEMQRRQWILSSLLTGSLFIIGFIHLAFFLLRREDRTNLFFSLICLAWGTNNLFSNAGGWLMATLIPSLPWSVAIGFDTASYVLSVPLILMFYHETFPQARSRIWLRFYQIVGGAFGLMVILSPSYFYTRFVPFYHFVSFSALAYLFYMYVKDLVKKREETIFLVPGYAILIVCAINDLLHDLKIIQTTYIVSWSIFFFILSYSFLLSFRSSKAFASVEKLSEELGRKNEELSRLDHLKDEFLAKTSHELRTPLNGIIGLADSLRDGVFGKMSEKAMANLAAIGHSGRRLAGLVNDILDFSRLKNRDIQLVKQAVDLKALTDIILNVTTPIKQERDLALINDIPDNLPYVSGDEDRLQQVLFNLVGNAVKFTEQGEIRVSAVEKDGRIEVSVSDTGRGIHGKDYDRIFESFEQVDAADAVPWRGTGLGLSITRHLVELHGGRIWLESEVGRGSTFRFTLPISPEEPRLRTEKAKSLGSPAIVSEFVEVVELAVPEGPKEEGKLEYPWVLVVDDDPVNLQVIVNYLAFQNISVKTRTGGRGALELMEREGPPNLVLLDLMMPGMTGYEVCLRIRETYSPSELPIIILTAKNQVTDLVKGFESGANDYLVKPFTKDELLARVWTHLKLAESFTTLRENLSLRKELDQRRQTEQDLRMMQRRLAESLNRVEDAVLAVNESGEISLSNEPCQALLGREADELLGRPLETVLTQEDIEKFAHLKNSLKDSEDWPYTPDNYRNLHFRDAEGKLIPTIVTLAPLNFEEENLALLILRPSKKLEIRSKNDDPTSLPVLKVIETLNRNRRRIQSLEESLYGSLPKILERDPGFIGQLKTIDTALEALSTSLVKVEDQNRTRRDAVELMNLVLEYWTESTQTTKFELAQRSKFWRVYTNLDGRERTQTLDRYLDLATLPKAPRWNQIVKTADFVLASCHRTSPLRERIEILLENFRISR